MSGQSTTSSSQIVPPQSVPSILVSLTAPAAATAQFFTYQPVITNSINMYPPAQFLPSLPATTVSLNMTAPMPVQYLPSLHDTFNSIQNVAPPRASPQILNLPHHDYVTTAQTHYIIRRSFNNPELWEILSEIEPVAAPEQWRIIGPPGNPQTLFMNPAMEHHQNPTLVPGILPTMDQPAAMEQVGGADHMQNEDEFNEVPLSSAFRNTLIYSNFLPLTPKPNLITFLQQLSYHLRNKVVNLLNRYGGIKIWTSTEIEYVKPNDTNSPVTKYLHTKAQTVFNDFELEDVVNKIIDQTMLRNANFIQERSGLVVHKVISTALHVSQHAPLTAAFGWSLLPKAILDKHAVINVKNKDNRCFGYALLSMLHPVEVHAERPAHYDNLFEMHHLEQLKYPVAPRDVSEIEDSIQMTISVYGSSEDGLDIFPIYISKKQFQIRIELLYWKEHFAWIKDFPALFFAVNKHKCRKLFCHNCLGHFHSKQALDNHHRNCQVAGFMSTIYTMPHPGTILKFKNVRHQQMLVFKIFADCESIIVPTIGNPKSCCHTPCGIGFKVVSLLPGIQIEYKSYRGSDCIDWFLATLVEIEKCLIHYLFEERPLIWDEDQNAQIAFAAAINCYLCGGEFGNDVNTQKVRDHDHITGIYRGAAHSKCNLQLQKTYKIPVFFHNFRGYDSHLLVHSLPKYPDRKISLIAQSMEKYLIMGWGQHLVFKDSLQFLNVSLERLVANLLKAGRDNFVNLLNEFPVGDNVDLLMRKGVYPYEYMDSFERFGEAVLPPIERFHSTLKDEDISAADYEHAKNVWNKFNCTNIGDYHDLYLKTDVLLLADVWNCFSKTCFDNYKLDPAHYVSAPHLTWDAMLLKTSVNIGLLSDPEMFSFYNNNIRGGVCYISKRHARANHPDLPDYDATMPIVLLPYLDANNLYGAAMMVSMPIGEFQWLERNEIDKIDWCAQSDDQGYGYTIECDLDYPPELHDSHNDYPLAPERLQVNYSCISDQQVEIARSYNIARNCTTTKLMPNLMNKRYYVCDYMNLKFYIEHGLILIGVHRVIRYRQSKWLMPYIQLNSLLRKNATQEHEKELFKLMNNATYGKTCENVTKRSDIRLVVSKNQCKRFIEKPHCMGFRIFGENLAAIQMEKLYTKIDKPTQVGFKVLEASKLVMMRFYYDQLKVWYGDRVHLLFTDTDSFLLEIQTTDWEADMAKYKEYFDLSFYPDGSPKRDCTNEKVYFYFVVLNILNIPKVGYLLCYLTFSMIQCHHRLSVNSKMKPPAQRLPSLLDYVRRCTVTLYTTTQNRTRTTVQRELPKPLRKG